MSYILQALIVLKTHVKREKLLSELDNLVQMKTNKFSLRTLKQSIKYRVASQSSQLRYKDTDTLESSLLANDPHEVLRLLKQSDAANYLNPQRRFLGPTLYRLFNFSYQNLKSTRAFLSRALLALKRRIPD
jgi:hypothetical protein